MTNFVRYSAWLTQDPRQINGIVKQDPTWEVDYEEYVTLFRTFRALSSDFPSRNHIPITLSNGDVMVPYTKHTRSDADEQAEYVAYLDQQWKALRECMTLLGNCRYVQRILGKAVKLGDLYCSITHRLLNKNVILENNIILPSNTYIQHKVNRGPVQPAVLASDSDETAYDKEMNIQSGLRVVYCLNRAETRNRYIAMLETDMFQGPE